MDSNPFFRIGDGVQLIVSFGPLASGARGRVVESYFPAMVYRVLFETEDRPRLVYGPDLARQPAEPARKVAA